MGALTKSLLAQQIEEQVGLESHQAMGVVEQFFETITATLANNETVQLTGLGNFNVRERPARIGRNPKTGETVPINARRVVKLQVSATLKEKLKTLCDKDNS